MKLLCWFAGHDWAWRTVRTGDPIGGPATERVPRCRRCHEGPYDSDMTGHERVLNSLRFGWLSRVRDAGKRVVMWVRTRPCWLYEHKWSPVSQYCERCGYSGADLAESTEWSLGDWKALWRQWLREGFHVVKPYLTDQAIYAVQTRSWRWGVEKSTLFIRGTKYMVRYICYLGPIGLRLHQFHSGDDDSAPHTHPWPFVTFPLHSYVEQLYKEGVFQRFNVVKKFRFHYRPAKHEHIVKGPMWSFAGRDVYYEGAPIYSDATGFEPFWTIVITGPKANSWGFYPEPGKFVYWREYKPGTRTAVKPS